MLLSKTITNLLLKIFSIILLLAIYEYLVSNNVKYIIQFDQLPSLKAILISFWKYLSSSEYLPAIIYSLQKVYVGFGIAFLVAVGLAITCSQYPKLYTVLSVYIEIFRPIPNIAWVPIAILLFPKVQQSVYFITFIGAFFPIFLNTYHGATHISQIYINKSKDLGLNFVNHLRFVIIPGSAKMILTGSVIGMGTSWLGVIVAESTYGTNGVGYLTFKNLQLLDYAGIIVGMATIGMLGTLSSKLLIDFGKLLIKWPN